MYVHTWFFVGTKYYYTGKRRARGKSLSLIEVPSWSIIQDILPKDHLQDLLPRHKWGSHCSSGWESPVQIGIRNPGSVFGGLGTRSSGAQQNLPKESSKVQDSFCIRLVKVNPSIPALLFFRVVENDDSLELGRLIDNVCKGDLDFSRTESSFNAQFDVPTTRGWMSWYHVPFPRTRS